MLLLWTKPVRSWISPEQPPKIPQKHAVFPVLFIQCICMLSHTLKSTKSSSFFFSHTNVNISLKFLWRNKNRFLSLCLFFFSTIKPVLPVCSSKFAFPLAFWPAIYYFISFFAVCIMVLPVFLFSEVFGLQF